MFANLTSGDPLQFNDNKPYTERIVESQAKTGLKDAIRAAHGKVDGQELMVACMDFAFIGGSMGSVVGEKIARSIDYSIKNQVPFLMISKSGGARMMEAAFSLMQMAKTSAKLALLAQAKIPYISLLTDPTTGGVTASFAMLGDLIFAEPKALIGFAGRRVIEQTLQEQLPDDFQTAEYLLHHGLLDLIVPRSFLKQALSETITLYKEAPLKVRGEIPYGERGPLTKVDEEQLRRFWKNCTDSKSNSLVKEFEFLLKSFGDNQQIQNVESGVVEKAFNLACTASTNWLNPSFEDFKVRTIFNYNFTK